MDYIVETILQRLGTAGSNPAQQRQPQRLSQEQGTQHRPNNETVRTIDQVGNNNPTRNNNSVRFNIQTQRHTYHRDDTDWRSTNPDFPNMCKTLFRMVQIRHHLNNWEDLPASLKRNLNHIGENITPPDPCDDLTVGIAGILNNTGKQLKLHVQAHLRSRLESNRVALTRLDPKDKDRAIDVVFNQLNRRLGKKITDLRNKIAEAAQHIGSERVPPNRRAPCPEPSDWLLPETPSSKRPRSSDTPSPVFQSSNRYQVLSNYVEGEGDMDTAITAELSSTADTLPPYQPQRLQPARKTKHKKDAPAIALLQDTSTIILGDSNLKNIPEDSIPAQWQVEVLPGAHFSHIIQAVDCLPEKPMDIIVSVGINHMDWSYKERTYGEICKLRDLATKRGHNLHAVGVSINPLLDAYRQQNLKDINQQLSRIFRDNYIGPLRGSEISTYNDNIHYDEGTVKKIWGSIVSHISNLRCNNDSTAPNLATDFPALSKN